MYTKRQSRLAKSFCHGATCCSVECSHCGRVHFTSALGHCDEGLQEQARANPDRYIEETFYDSIDWGYWNGKQFVPDCPCGVGDRIADGIEGCADALAKYLRLYYEDKLSDLKREQQQSQEMLDGLRVS